MDSLPIGFGDTIFLQLAHVQVGIHTYIHTYYIYTYMHTHTTTIGSFKVAMYSNLPCLLLNTYQKHIYTILSTTIRTYVHKYTDLQYIHIYLLA